MSASTQRKWVVGTLTLLILVVLAWLLAERLVEHTDGERAADPSRVTATLPPPVAQDGLPDAPRSDESVPKPIEVEHDPPAPEQAGDEAAAVVPDVLTVFVVDKQGAPIPGAAVWWAGAVGVDTTITDEDGLTAIGPWAGRTPGRYYASALRFHTASGWLENVDAGRLTIALEPAAGIELRVRSTGAVDLGETLLEIMYPRAQAFERRSEHPSKIHQDLGALPIVRRGRSETDCPCWAWAVTPTDWTWIGPLKPGLSFTLSLMQSNHSLLKQRVVLATGETKTLDWVVDHRLGILRGVVLHADGSPAAGARVDVFARERQTKVRCFTDSRGRFEAPPIESADVAVVATVSRAGSALLSSVVLESFGTEVVLQLQPADPFVLSVVEARAGRHVTDFDPTVSWPPSGSAAVDGAWTEVTGPAPYRNARWYSFEEPGPAPHQRQWTELPDAPVDVTVKVGGRRWIRNRKPGEQRATLALPDVGAIEVQVVGWPARETPGSDQGESQGDVSLEVRVRRVLANDDDRSLVAEHVFTHAGRERISPVFAGPHEVTANLRGAGASWSEIQSLDLDPTTIPLVLFDLSHLAIR